MQAPPECLRIFPCPGRAVACLLDVMEDDLSVARGALLSGCAPLLAFTTRSHCMWSKRQAKTLEKA